MSVTDTSSVRSYRKSPPQHGHWLIVTGTGCGGPLVAVAAGAPRKVKGPLPALRPDRFRLFFRLDWPCDFFPRPAAFSSLRSCSFSRRSRSISCCDSRNRSRRIPTSASRSSNCFRRSLGPGDPSMATYRHMKLSACPVFFLTLTGCYRFVQPCRLSITLPPYKKDIYRGKKDLDLIEQPLQDLLRAIQANLNEALRNERQ